MGLNPLGACFLLSWRGHIATVEGQTVLYAFQPTVTVLVELFGLWIHSTSSIFRSLVISHSKNHLLQVAIETDIAGGPDNSSCRQGRGGDLLQWWRWLLTPLACKLKA